MQSVEDQVRRESSLRKLQLGSSCEYLRERKKRGKVSRKDIAKQLAAAAAAAATASGEVSQGSSQSVKGNSLEVQNAVEPAGCGNRVIESRVPASQLAPPTLPSLQSIMQEEPHSTEKNKRHNGIVTMTSIDPAQHHALSADGRLDAGYYMTTTFIDNGSTASDERIAPGASMTDYTSNDQYQDAVVHPSVAPTEHPPLHSATDTLPHSMIPPSNLQAYENGFYTLLHPQNHPGPPNGFQSNTTNGPLLSFLGSPPAAGSPEWLSLPSPSAALYTHNQSVNPIQNQKLRYPVLQPLLPYLGSVVHVSLACDLLDAYFESSSATFMQPASPYVLGYVFRKRSFLRQTSPRVCSPALLASMLFIGAQTSELTLLTSPPSARSKTCRKLLELTVRLLKPLIHTPSASNEATHGSAASGVFNGAALGGLGIGPSDALQGTEGVTPGATGALDDVATYMHLATVISATENKAASLRWWNAAWSLARELKLGRELPPNPIEPPFQEAASGKERDIEGRFDLEMGTDGIYQDPRRVDTMQDPPAIITEEEREERRRIWWLLYTMDRHLSLCYNKPLFLLDAECEGLLQPIDDSIWQAGEYYSMEPHHAYVDSGPTYVRRIGPTFECTGHSIFGYFTPLMTILGEIVDLKHARNHPWLGLRFRSGSHWDEHQAEIAVQLEVYGRSLRELEARNTSTPMDYITEEGHPEAATRPVHRLSTSGTRITESILQTKMVVAYGTYLMHTLHTLLNGKWDPISLLDDNDLWISSQSFITATGHAVSAAEALSDILEHDPDASFMPFFFGIYLLQGSFLLLLIADKLQGDAGPSVVKACETIVRAHEACVVTLNTEYQRNFRRVMRSALAQVRGRLPEDPREAQSRRRKVLALYRWTGGGTGLAL
ncbi:hypothetical protein H2199_003255 [Coniosporium tulheliwenetii]|uniref:Uncharacterized protein n=1 Tax=Coniosporium tulheliwenetii TaxID=3383036 RepID=A0ACC2ZC34_9PEZI|nr:hypothetical protein H2199_003255 [Cladosporium sp. JES 115]